jgi:integrase
MREISVPFLHKERDRTWHWKPSKAARRLGFKNVALGTDEVAAAQKALKLWQQYQLKRAGAYNGTFNHLRDVYCGTDDGKIEPAREWKKLSAETQRDYKRYIKVICERFGADQVDAMDAEIARALHESYADRPYAGNQCIKVLGIMMDIAIGRPSLFPKMKDRANPCDTITMYGEKEGVESRERTWTDEEIAAFDEQAHPELLMARLLYSYTGQRTADVLKMMDTDYKVEDGEPWLHVTQQKTRKRIWVYCHADLVPAIEAHIARHKAADAERQRNSKVAVLYKPGEPRPLLQDGNGQKFNRRSFVTRWDRTARRAGIKAPKGQPPLGDEPRRHDLRRTAVTRLAEAGCTDDQISSITGLSRAMIQQQVYNVRSKAHSKAGIKKLEDYRK